MLPKSMAAMDAPRTNNSAEIVEVFRHNFKEEERRLLAALSRYKTVAFDTEYPGAIDQTPQFADEETRYRDLKSNVERTKLIQVGFAVFDHVTSELGGVWQFNFAGFSPQYHDHQPSSIRLLESSGIDFVGNCRRGVRMAQFTRLLKRIRDDHAAEIRWVTFHGLYDAAYLLAAVSGAWKLPSDILGFAESAGSFFRGGIFDLKRMAGAQSWMGLEKLATTMGAAREQGLAHQAGSDSLLTARVFVKALRILDASHISLLQYWGLLFGIDVRIISSRYWKPLLQIGTYNTPCLHSPRVAVNIWWSELDSV